jgi:hypothetical protein
MDLERELRAVEIAWPDTPALRVDLAPRRRRRLLLAVAVVLVAVAAAFGVPESRGAILRFLGFGSVRIELVQELPNAQERPLSAGLGPVVSRSQLKQRVLLPPLTRMPPLHRSYDVVSLVFEYRGEPVLLSEVPGADPMVLKKVAAEATRIVPVGHGLWLTGARHVFLFPGAPPRLAGNVLLWQRDGLTLRLEGRKLALADAVALMKELR